MPHYILRRDLQSIEEIWTEYDVGFPPFVGVQELQTRYKGKWRNGATEDRYFLRQKIFYAAIERESKAEGTSGELIARRMEQDRKEKNFTIAKYRDHLAGRL